MRRYYERYVIYMKRSSWWLHAFDMTCVFIHLAQVTAMCILKLVYFEGWENMFFWLRYAKTTELLNRRRSTRNEFCVSYVRQLVLQVCQIFSLIFKNTWGIFVKSTWRASRSVIWRTFRNVDLTFSEDTDSHNPELINPRVS